MFFYIISYIFLAFLLVMKNLRIHPSLSLFPLFKSNGLEHLSTIGVFVYCESFDLIGCTRLVLVNFCNSGFNQKRCSDLMSSLGIKEERKPILVLAAMLRSRSYT